MASVAVLAGVRPLIMVSSLKSIFFDPSCQKGSSTLYR